MTQKKVQFEQCEKCILGKHLCVKGEIVVGCVGGRITSVLQNLMEVYCGQ